MRIPGRSLRLKPPPLWLERESREHSQASRPVDPSAEGLARDRLRILSPTLAVCQLTGNLAGYQFRELFFLYVRADDGQGCLVAQ
jgi:hypothetical protein